jgi:hypothetical protein
LRCRPLVCRELTVLSSRRQSRVTASSPLGIGRRCALYGCAMGARFARAPPQRPSLSEVRRSSPPTRRGDIEPRVAERITLDAVADAHTRIERGGLERKIVLVPNG